MPAARGLAYRELLEWDDTVALHIGRPGIFGAIAFSRRGRHSAAYAVADRCRHPDAEYARDAVSRSDLVHLGNLRLFSDTAGWLDGHPGLGKVGRKGESLVRFRGG